MMETAHESIAGTVSPAQANSSIRHAAATAWQNILYWSARRTPWFTRMTSPFWMRAAWTFSPMIRSNTLANARQLLGPDASNRELVALAQQVLLNCYLFVYDVGRALRMSDDELRVEVEAVEGQEHYDGARSQRRGAVVATAHLGSFEIGMAALCRQERRVSVVFKRDRLSGFERIRHELHKKLGVIEAVVDDGWDTWFGLRDALARDEVVVLQADRVMPGQKGVLMPFCGGLMPLPPGPVKLAKLTGSPIIPVFALRASSGKVRIVIEPPIEVGMEDSGSEPSSPALRRLATVLEKQLRAHPEQWLALHNAWGLPSWTSES
jgi:phosphatidylinositol dimannoside acyltransferase